MTEAVTFLSFRYPDNGDDYHLVSVEEFSQANSDDPDMVADVLAAVTCGDEYHGGGGAQPIFIVTAATPEQLAECAPDISDLVAAIRDVILAADAYDNAFPNIAEDQATPHQHEWVKAFDRLRALHQWCEAYVLALGPREAQDA